MCRRLWTALQVLWSTLYVICGAGQLMAGIFFTISVPDLHIYSILCAGIWNIVIGITSGMVACILVLSPKRQEILLYMSISILTVNTVNMLLMEYRFYVADILKVLNNYSNHVLIDYACFVTRIASAVVLLVAFVDSQVTFCSMQVVPEPRNKKLRASHEHVADIEYIIPRPKSAKPQSHNAYNAYAQSWVFEAENASCSTGLSGTNHTTSFRALQNGTPKKPGKKVSSVQNGIVKETGHVIDNPVVHIEEASDDSTSNSDRKLCYMKSFSRSQSPVILSASSSQISLNLNQAHNPPIYEYLEKLTEPTIYRSRLDTALSNREEEVQYQAPQAVMMRRVETTSPHVEKVQYASLMKELQRAIVNKKEPPSVTSPLSQSSESATTSEKTKSSSHSESKNSDADFCKELEAALQLIQDLESPNTIETPSETKSPLDGQARALAVWQSSDASESSEKTAVGSLPEITSPISECQPELYKPKGASVIVHCPDSQSTSGYSSPNHGPTPNWSTTSSINGSNPDIKLTSYSIHNNASNTVISLYTSTPNHTKGKSVTLVKISDSTPSINSTKIIVNSDNHSTILPSEHTDTNSTNKVDTNTDVKERHFQPQPLSVSSNGWKLNSLLRKKKRSALPKLAPELEAAIIKSESLAYLSDLELLARHQRNQEVQREIEKKVVQQLGVPRTGRTESNC